MASSTPGFSSTRQVVHEPVLINSRYPHKRRAVVVYNIRIIDERQRRNAERELQSRDVRAELPSFINNSPTYLIEEAGPVWQGAEEVVVSEFDSSLVEEAASTCVNACKETPSQQQPYEPLTSSPYEFFENINVSPHSPVVGIENDEEVRLFGVQRSYDRETNAYQQQIACDLQIASTSEEYPSVPSFSDSTTDEYLHAISSLYRSNRKSLRLQREHLARPIYKCPLCTYGSTYHRTNVVAHMRQRHGIPNPADSEVGNVERWPMEIVFVDELITSRKRRNVEYSTVYSSRCALCDLSGILHRERHVLQHHLNKSVFTCPHCDFSSCYAKYSVKDHIRTQHPHMATSEPLDLRPRFRDRIDYLYMKCFAIGYNQNDAKNA
ncbi:hypothetical protein Tcan_03472 [Toxocara canis]|uniref:C2H2-type domain-containing protein n=1 Tax=Toxocara canis TaxID=6265 RepID=A0A0B2VDS1_TOXCA|nr:hypothetical protein Tcan_03472 [Toxocara canis]